MSQRYRQLPNRNRSCSISCLNNWWISSHNFGQNISKDTSYLHCLDKLQLLKLYLKERLLYLFYSSTEIFAVFYSHKNRCRGYEYVKFMEENLSMSHILILSCHIFFQDFLEIVVHLSVKDNVNTIKRSFGQTNVANTDIALTEKHKFRKQWRKPNRYLIHKQK